MRVLMLIGLSASFALPLAFAAQNATGCNPVGKVGKEIWLGSVVGDRIARFPAAQFQ